MKFANWLNGYRQEKEIAAEGWVFSENDMLNAFMARAEPPTATLRDKFAGQAMQGLWGSPDMQGLLQQMADNEDVTKEEQAMELLAGIAYRQADAMLKYRTGAE